MRLGDVGSRDHTAVGIGAESPACPRRTGQACGRPSSHHPRASPTRRRTCPPGIHPVGRWAAVQRQRGRTVVSTNHCHRRPGITQKARSVMAPCPEFEQDATDGIEPCTEIVQGATVYQPRTPNTATGPREWCPARRPCGHPARKPCTKENYPRRLNPLRLLAALVTATDVTKVVTLLTNSPKQLNHVGNQQKARGNLGSMAGKGVNVSAAESFELSRFASVVQVLRHVSEAPFGIDTGLRPVRRSPGNWGSRPAIQAPARPKPTAGPTGVATAATTPPQIARTPRRLQQQHRSARKFNAGDQPA
jgi:hypothetical protein